MSLQIMSFFENVDSKFIEILTMVIRYGFNVATMYLLVNVIYHQKFKDSTYSFTFVVFNTLMFFVCYLMSSSNLGVGFGFGLFALFAIIRYRTSTIPIKEMTYLFTVIIIGVINAIAVLPYWYIALFFINGVILLLIYVLNKAWLVTGQYQQQILYEKIDLIKPQNHKLLLEDLKSRTGLDIEHFEIKKINFLNDTALIQVFCGKPDRIQQLIEERKRQMQIIKRV